MHISIIIMRLAAIRIMARSSFSRCVYYIRPMPVVKDFLQIFSHLLRKNTNILFCGFVFYANKRLTFQEFVQKCQRFSNYSRF